MNLAAPGAGRVGPLFGGIYLPAGARLRAGTAWSEATGGADPMLRIGVISRAACKSASVACSMVAMIGVCSTYGTTMVATGIAPWNSGTEISQTDGMRLERNRI